MTTTCTCLTCGSEDIEITATATFNPNTDAIEEWEPETLKAVWCNRCQDDAPGYQLLVGPMHAPFIDEVFANANN